MSIDDDPIVSGLRQLGQRIDSVTELLQRKLVSSRVKNYTYKQMIDLIEYFADRFYDSCGVKYAMNGKTIGFAKAILSSIPFDEAVQMVHAAFMDPWFSAKCRDIGYLAANPNKFRLAPIRPSPVMIKCSENEMPWDDSRMHPSEDDSLKTDIRSINEKLGL